MESEGYIKKKSKFIQQVGSQRKILWDEMEYIGNKILPRCMEDVQDNIFG